MGVILYYVFNILVNRELYGEKVTELYFLNRKYEEWNESLKIYLSNNDYKDLTKVIDPITNVFTNGDLTKIPNVDWFHEYLSMMNEFCLLYTSRCV